MRTLIAANWKMHGLASWTSKPDEFNRLLPAKDRQNIDVLICPPFTLISDMVRAAEGKDIKIGAQTCHSEMQGAYTGEVSAQMLADTGASYVIIGHSERRAMGEADGDVRAKGIAADEAGLIPIICVGEPLSIREKGEAVEFVINQLVHSIPKGIRSYVVAYEPIWAIGTGKVPSLSDIEDIHLEIRRLIGPSVRILYGGSVKPSNAREILSLKSVSGALIGGASLDMESLAEISRTVL